MRAIKWLILAVAVTGFVFWTSKPTEAATLFVPRDFPTIQLAVDAAAPGDKVMVSPGVYFENVVIGTPGITLAGFPTRSVRGRGSPAEAVLDASQSGNGIEINADNVTVEKLTQRHAGSDGIQCNADGCRIREVKVLNAGDDCIELNEDFGIVERNLVFGCGDIGIDVDDDDDIIRGNTVRGVDNECIEVDGDRVLIDGNNISNCEDDEGIDADGDDNIISNNVIRHTDGEGIESDGDRVRILRNDIFNTDDNGIEFDGEDNVISGNKIDSTSDEGIEGQSGSHRAVIENNTVMRTSDDDGIDTRGRQQVVRNNTVEGTGEECIDVHGIRPRVEGNRTRACDDGGIDVDGENPVVKNNRVEGAGDDEAYDVSCYNQPEDSPPGMPFADACSEGLVEGNYGNGSNNDDEGFDIDVEGGTNSSSFTIRNNTAEQNNEQGFEISCDRCRIIGNRAHRNAAEEDEAGITIFGNENLIENNVATENRNSGFFIGFGSSDNILRGNVAENNNEDGIDIKGDDNTLENNRATGNQGEGFENDGSDTILTNNTAVGNRIDCANDGSILTNTGNTCADGSNFTVGGEID